MRNSHLFIFLASFLATAAAAVTPNPKAVAAVPEPVGAVVFAAGAALVLASVRRTKR